MSTNPSPYVEAILLIMAIFGLRWTLVGIWGWLQAFAQRRLWRHIEATRAERSRAIYRKFLRHAPSGRVGLCVEAAFTQHRWLGWLRVVETVDLIVCPGCARRELEPPVAFGPVTIRLSMEQPGHRIRVPLRETVAALDSEITAFRSAMENCNPEGNEP